MNSGVHSYKLVYLIGVGGIGMSALARFFNHLGKKVVGYDKTNTSLTDKLTSEGIACHFNEDLSYAKQIVSDFEKKDVLVIYTPAVPKDHAELSYFQSNEFICYKRSQVLGKITENYKTIAIAGTHGKTTTTTMVTHLLKHSGINCFSFMGGISKNYHTNLILGDLSDTNALFVVEADEYDRSFLFLKPFYSIITSCDADHLDIYGNHDYVKESYTLFARLINKSGKLIVNKNVDNDLTLPENKVIYSLNLNTDYVAENVCFKDFEAHFDLKSPIDSILGICLGVSGQHNVENAVAAITLVQQIGLSAEQIKSALRSFNGVSRRFDVRISSGKTIYIDDYAHHPEELNAIIRSVKKVFPEKKIAGIFQPHLFSRTRDFADEFAKSLSQLDTIILLEIYPARELPIEGVNSQMLLDLIDAGKEKYLLSKDEVLEKVQSTDYEVLLTMGAGDIDKLVQPIETILKSKE